MALALLVAAPAAADQLAFGCGQGFENLCRARPDGTGLERLTTGGDASRATDSFYRAPALSRDGRTLAYVFESDVFLRPPAAELSAVIGGTRVCTYNSDLSGTNEGRNCLATGEAAAWTTCPTGGC